MVSEFNIKLGRAKDVVQNETDKVDDSSRETLLMLLTKIDLILVSFNGILPILTALCSEGMRRKDWNKVNIKFLIFKVILTR